MSATLIKIKQFSMTRLFTVRERRVQFRLKWHFSTMMVITRAAIVS